MKVQCSGNARIRHSETDAVYTVICSELEWDEQGMGEGPMGAESEHRAVLEHPVLGTLTWKIGEYPVGVEDYRETDVGKHSLLENLEYRLEHEPADRTP